MAPWLVAGARALPARTRRWLAMRALRRKDRALPLALTGHVDPVVLAALGLHRRALALVDARPSSDPAQLWARIAALCGTGEGDRAAALALGARDRLRGAWRRKTAQALAPIRPEAALSLLSGTADPLAAALLWRQGKGLLAAEMQTRPPTHSRQRSARGQPRARRGRA